MKKILFLFLVVILIGGINCYGYSFGPGVSKNHKRPIIAENQRKIIEENKGIYIGEDSNVIYLTFDCGYENGYTERILDVLAKTNIKAVFFITEHYLSSAINLVKRMVEEGHIIGNHTASHKDFTKSTDEEILNDIKRLENLFFEKTGFHMSKLVRPPRGEFSEKSQKLLASEGYTSVFWSLAYVDWEKDKFYGNNYSYQKVMNRIHNGAIILMHSVSKDNCVDLEDIIVDLKESGFKFALIEEVQ